MAWVSLCHGFSSAILYTGVILYFRVFPIMPSCYLLEVNSFSPLLSIPHSYYKESPSLGESSQLVELVWGRNWVWNCVLGHLDKSIAGPALLCRTALVVGFPDYCRKPPRVSVGTTNLHSVLTNQCYSLKLKHEPRLILFSSLFWVLQLPVATQWCFTVNFVCNTFFSFLFVFLLFSQLPQAQKVISFLSHLSHCHNSQSCMSMVLCIWLWSWPVKGFPPTTSQTERRMRTQRPLDCVHHNPHPCYISPFQEPSRGQGLTSESIPKHFPKTCQVIYRSRVSWVQSFKDSILDFPGKSPREEER